MFREQLGWVGVNRRSRNEKDCNGEDDKGTKALELQIMTENVWLLWGFKLGIASLALMGIRGIGRESC